MTPVNPNPARFSRRSRRRMPGGFTLIELLAVIAIIGILAATIIPVVGKVRESARRSQSMSNVRSCAQAAVLFANDNRGGLPFKPDTKLDGGSNTILDRTEMEPYLPWMSPAWFCPVVKRVQEGGGSKATSPTEDWVGRIRYNYNLMSPGGWPATGWHNRSGRGSRNMRGVNLTSVRSPSSAMLFWNCSSGGRAGYNDGFAHLGMADGSVRKVRDDSYLGVEASAVRAQYINEQPAASGKMQGFDI